MSQNSKTAAKLYKIAQVVAMLFAAFLFLFSFDVIVPGLSVLDMIIGFFMHNIPVMVLLVIIFMPRKFAFIKGLLFILAAIAYIIMAYQNVDISAILVIGISPMIVGLLYIASFYFTNQNNNSN